MIKMSAARKFNLAVWVAIWLGIAAWSNSYGDIPRLLGNAVIPFVLGWLIDRNLRDKPPPEAASRPSVSDVNNADEPENADIGSNENDEEVGTVAAVQAACQWAKNRYDEFVTTGDEYEREQYERFKKTAGEKTSLIQDDFYHDAACHQLIDLCMQTEAAAEAQEWFAQMRDGFVKEKVLGSYPQISTNKIDN